MPAKQRRRPPQERVYEAIQQPQQVHFTPPNQAIVRKNRPISTPRTKQQTLTQIDFVSRPIPRNEALDLQYLEEERPRERKRRKTVHDESSVSRVQTRSAKRRAMKEEQQDEIKLQNVIHAPQKEPQIATAAMDHALMPPPKTPCTIRRTEVPSSISPVVTPLSTKSRRARDSFSRSPLKERSTNIGNPQYPASELLNTTWKPKLEVCDSFDSENWGSESSNQVSSFARKSEASPRSLGNPSKEHTTSSSFEERTTTGILSEYGEIPQMGQATQTFKSEIADSDEDEEEDDIGDYDMNEFDIGAETQFAMTYSGGSQNLFMDPEQTSSSEAVYRTAKNRALPTHPESPPHNEANSSTISRGSPKTPRASQYVENKTDNSLPTPFSGVEILPDPLFMSRVKQSPSPHPLSDSQQASRQLNTDLRCLTQPPQYIPTIESDSQFENAFRNYSPPNLIQDSEEEEDDDDEVRVKSVSEPEEIEEPSLSHSSYHRASSLPPLDLVPIVQVPSSQATTVDMTQLPPSARFSRCSQNVHSAPALTSSSPLRDTTRSSQIEVDWDGKHLTDSQLLPESLMNDSLRPAPFWQEEDEIEDVDC